MTTIRQRVRKHSAPKKKVTRSKALEKNPFLKGYCLKILKITPKKPNSGNRSAAVVRLTNFRTVLANIPGEMHSLAKHSVVLVRGARLPDLPRINYKIVRGKLDATSVSLRRKRRSKYGVKKL